MNYYEPKAVQFERDMIELRRRLFGSLAFILIVTVAGIIGFSVIDPDAGFIRAFFMTAITLTTVGYNEEIAVDTDGARIFTAILILVGMGATLYFVSTVTAFLLEGQLGHVFRRRRMIKELEGLRGHQIVCGAGPTALYAARELASVGRAVVVIAPTEEDAERAFSQVRSVPVVVGDATDDDILTAAGIQHAHGVIACSESDNENVVVTLTARQLNPNVRIVTRLADIDQEFKARKVGANGVVSPQHIGGLRLATELVRPTVVDFIETMVRDDEHDIQVDEVFVVDGSPAAGVRIADLPLGESAPLLLALRPKDGAWTHNPPPDHVVQPGAVLVFLGTQEETRAVRSRLGVPSAP